MSDVTIDVEIFEYMAKDQQKLETIKTFLVNSMHISEYGNPGLRLKVGDDELIALLAALFPNAVERKEKELFEAYNRKEDEKNEDSFKKD